MSEFYDRLRPVLEKISAEAMADIELRETIAVLQTELRSAQENWKAACHDIAERDATIAALTKERDLALRSAQQMKDAWDAACHDVGELTKDYYAVCKDRTKMAAFAGAKSSAYDEVQVYVKELQEEVQRYKAAHVVALDCAKGLIACATNDEAEQVGALFKAQILEALKPPSGETSATEFKPQCPLCSNTGFIVHNRLTGHLVDCECAAANAQEPDSRCLTTPDGGCIADDCMHTDPPSTARRRNGAPSVEDKSIDLGMDLAQKAFYKRGNHSEIHLSKPELAALLSLAALSAQEPKK